MKHPHPTFNPAFTKTDIENLNAQFTISSYSPSLGEGVAFARQQGNERALEAIARLTGVPIPAGKPAVATTEDYERLDALVGGDQA